MKKIHSLVQKPAFITFVLILTFSMALGVAFSYAQPAVAAPAPASPAQDGGEGGTEYAGSESCSECHRETHETWTGTLHSQAFSSPVFQQDWAKQGSINSCLECHTTGYDPLTGKYAEAGVTCESCHGPLQKGHGVSGVPMSITPDYTLCARCHKTTTDEWQASAHGEAKINCESCHNSHSQAPRAESINALCGNCHKGTGSSFTHGTHSNAGLQCSDCHISGVSHLSTIGGLFTTGHTFVVGSEACVKCHADTVHTRDTILELSGQTAGEAPTMEELEKQVHEQEQTIKNLEAQSAVRLYTGLMQGAIVGLTIGGVAAWVVSRRIKIVEVEDNG